MPDQPRYSIVAPVYNEAAGLEEFYRRVSGVMHPIGEPWELLLVNDGSRDHSLEVMRCLRAADSHVRIVDLARNFGHEIAVTAGLDHSRGQAVIMMDADLQDPPELIPDLIARWKEGYEVAYARRVQREGETWFKLLTARLFYRMIARITDVKIPMDTGNFRLMDRAVVDALGQMRERHRFFRGMSAWVGFRQIDVPYRRAARFAGETHYPLGKMVRLAVNAITGFSYFPLQLATYLGFVCAGISALAIPVVIVLRLAGNDAFYGQASTLITVLFLGGVQLISLGILGEYLGRIYDEVKARPLYIARLETEETPGG